MVRIIQIILPYDLSHHPILPITELILRVSLLQNTADGASRLVRRPSKQTVSAMNHHLLLFLIISWIGLFVSPDDVLIIIIVYKGATGEETSRSEVGGGAGKPTVLLSLG